MIGSWFPLENGRTTWSWEVVSADGATVASGVSADEQSAGWDCRTALFAARTEAGDQITDIAQLNTAGVGGRWAAAATARV